jgi:serine/threonine protein kinase
MGLSPCRVKPKTVKLVFAASPHEALMSKSKDWSISKNIFSVTIELFEWVSDCCLMPTQQFFSYIMARISQFSMRWWWDPLCTLISCSNNKSYWFIFFQLDTLQYIHEKGYAHADIKASNLLTGFTHGKQQPNQVKLHHISIVLDQYA